MKYKLKSLLSLTVLCCLASSCATSVSKKETRIAEHKDFFDKLEPQEQEAVQQGAVTKGMSKKAVYLSLGAPSSQTEGYQNGTNYDRWDYSSIRPALHSGFSSSYGHGGFGRGGFGRRGFGHGGFSRGFGHSGFGRRGFGHGGFNRGFGFGHSVSYVPVNYATVLFKNNQVNSWSIRR